MIDGKQYLATGWLYSEVARKIRINGYSNYWNTQLIYSIDLPAGEWTYFATPTMVATNPSQDAHATGFAALISGETGNDVDPFWMDDFAIWKKEY